jgi:hypothetical protein
MITFLKGEKCFLVPEEFIFFFFFWNAGSQTQGLTLVRKVFYHMNHLSSPEFTLFLWLFCLHPLLADTNGGDIGKEKI